jgi:hypothetical protein
MGFVPRDEKNPPAPSAQWNRLPTTKAMQWETLGKVEGAGSKVSQVLKSCPDTI